MRRCCIPLLFLLVFAGCSPHVRLRILENGGADGAAAVRLDASTEQLVRSIAAVPDDVPLFDTERIQAALAASGIPDVSVSAPHAAELTVSARLETLSQAEELAPGLLSVSREDGHTACRFRLSPRVFAALLGRLPADTAAYADLLMAPVITGEELSQEAYLSLIAAVYGSGAASTLALSSVTVEITAPSAVVSAAVSLAGADTDIRGSTALYTVPLAAFLCENSEIIFRIQY